MGYFLKKKSQTASFPGFLSQICCTSLYEKGWSLQLTVCLQNQRTYFDCATIDDVLSSECTHSLCFVAINKPDNSEHIPQDALARNSCSMPQFACDTAQFSIASLCIVAGESARKLALVAFHIFHTSETLSIFCQKGFRMLLA